MRWSRTLVAACVLGEAIVVHAAKKKYGKRCEEHDDCKSGFCNDDSTCGCAMRLDAKTFCPKKKQICVENFFNSLDHVCALPQLKANNEECKDPLECITTFCSQAYKRKLCTLTPGAKNSPCRSNTHCRQGYECSTGNSGSLGKCIVSGCTTAADCPAGKFCNEKAKCVDVLRPGDDCDGEDERCSSGQCLDDKCTCTVSSNNACKSPFVCHESLCKLPRGKRCSSNDDCLSTVCNPNRECGCDNDHDACPSDKSCIRSPRDNFVCRKNIAAFGVKADGEECEKGNECLGNFCVNLKCSSNGGALHDSCFGSEDCAHGLECTSLSRTTHTCKVVEDGLCGSDDDCIDGHCVNNQCHVNDGGHFSFCTESSDCADGLDCSGKKCRWLADNSCNRGADCFSRRCVKNFCHVNDGEFDKSCEEDNDCEGSHQCRNQKCKKAMDESCAANDDCFSEFCVNSKCHENDGSLGEACAMNNDCEGSALECAGDETCKRVDGEMCNAATECLGGNCVNNQCHSHAGQLKDRCVDSDDCGDTLKCNTSPKICLKSSDGECKTNDECLSSFCVNKRCHENNGGFNQECYNNLDCGTFLGCRRANDATSGKCRYTNGRPCTAAWQCLNAFCVSGECHSDDGSLNKECVDGQDCQEGLLCVAGSCKWSENETCGGNDDCSTGFCVNDKCHANNGELGASCAEDNDCEGSALECAGDKTCKRVDDEVCDAAAECLGGNCVNNQCHSHAGQLKDRCVDSDDCGDTLKCNTSPKICLQSNDKECGANDECLSSFCVNKRCHENDGGFNDKCQRNSDCGQFLGCKLASDVVGAEGECKFNNARPCVGNGQCLSGFCFANKCNPHSGGMNMGCNGEDINCNVNHECLLSEGVCRRKNGMLCKSSSVCASEYCSPSLFCEEKPATL